MQSLTRSPVMIFAVAYGNRFIIYRDCRQTEYIPPSSLYKVTAQVVEMNTLCNENDDACLLIIKTGDKVFETQ